MSLYIPISKEHPMRKVFNSHPMPELGKDIYGEPRELACHLVHFEEQEDSPEYWTVRLYRDNFNFFTGEDRLRIFNWVSDIIKSMRVIEPRSYVEVHERMPR